MSEYRFPREALREAICWSVPRQGAQFGDEPPELRFVYVPRAHAHALDADSMLVQGIRGAGKSLWWAALQSDRHRDRVARALSRSRIGEGSGVSTGFG